MNDVQEDLMKKYHQLPHVQKKTLQVLSITYMPVTQTQLIACFTALDIKTEDGVRFDSGTPIAMFKLLRKDLDSLLNKGFFDGKNRSPLMVKRHIVEEITRNLVAEKQLPAMAEPIQKILNLREDDFLHKRISDIEQLIAVMRIMFYQKKIEQATSLYHKCSSDVTDYYSLLNVWQIICCNPFDAGWFKLLPPDIHTQCLKAPLIRDITSWQNNSPYPQYTEELVITGSDRCEPELEAAVLEKWMLTGQKKTPECLA